MNELIFVKSFDDMRSIAESALNWFLDIEYQEVHDILEYFEEEDQTVACSYEDYELLQEEKKKLREMEQIKKKKEYYKALARETELNGLTLEFLERRVFSNKDVLMIQWLSFLLKDSNKRVDMEMEMEIEFGKSTMKMWDMKLCFAFFFGTGKAANEIGFFFASEIIFPPHFQGL